MNSITKDKIDINDNEECQEIISDDIEKNGNKPLSDAALEKDNIEKDQCEVVVSVTPAGTKSNITKYEFPEEPSDDDIVDEPTTIVRENLQSENIPNDGDGDVVDHGDQVRLGAQRVYQTGRRNDGSESSMNVRGDREMIRGDLGVDQQQQQQQVPIIEANIVNDPITVSASAIRESKPCFICCFVRCYHPCEWRKCTWIFIAIIVILIATAIIYSSLFFPVELSPSPAPVVIGPDYELEQVGQPITGKASYDFLGLSISLSRDAKRIAIGSLFHGGPNANHSGLVHVYQRRDDSDEWKQIGSTIHGDDGGDWFEWDVSLSGNGNVISVNAASRHHTLYEYVENAWKRRGQSLPGTRVSLSQNGSRVAVSGSYGAQMYEFDNSTRRWMMMGEGIGEETRDTKVAISGDGTRMAVGSYLEDDNGSSSGRVRLFEYNVSRFELVPLGQSLHGHARDEFGGSLSLSLSGDTVAVGSLAGNYVRIFALDPNSGEWEQKGDDINGIGRDNDIFGYSVSLSEYGGRVVIGSRRFDNSRGRAVLYEYYWSDWIEIGGDVEGKFDGDKEGWDVSISPEGDYIALAAPNADENGMVDTGRVRVFEVIEVVI